MKKRQFIIGLLVGVVIVSLGIGVTSLLNRDLIGYVAGHGRIVIEAPNFDHFTYSEVLDERTDRSFQSELVVPKGDYTVTVYLEEAGTGVEPVATQYSATVSVNGWLQPSVVKPVTKLQPFEKVMGSVSNQLVPLDVGHYLTYDEDHDPKTNFADGRTLSYEEIYSACYMGSEQILLLGDAGANMYDITARSLTPYETDEFDLMAVPTQILKSARCVDDSTQFVHDVSIVRLGLEGVELIALPYVDRIAKGERGLLADTAKSTVAVVVGNDFPVSPDSETVHEAGSLGGSQLIIHRDGSEVSRLNFTKWDYVVDMSLSPDGSKVAVQVDEFIGVYDSETTELLYAMPAYLKKTFWAGNNSLIYRGEPNEGSIFVADIAKRESYGLNNTNEIGIWTISNLIDGYLYLSGYELSTDGSTLEGYQIKVK